MSRTFYHYTTIAGCHSIITSRKIRFTDYRFLNDKQELKQGLTEFLSHLPDGKRGAFEEAFNFHSSSTSHCVLSMSKSQKILSQWQEYADGGTGVAIGFNEQMLKYRKINLVECKYKNHELYARGLAEKHTSFIDEVHQAALDCHDQSFFTWISQHTADFTAVVEDLIALKNPAFEAEQEVRAVWSSDRGAVKMRISGQLMVSYTEANFWEDDEEFSSMAVAVPEIWLGPKCNELNHTALALINMGFCTIEKYDCGYR